MAYIGAGIFTLILSRELYMWASFFFDRKVLAIEEPKHQGRLATIESNFPPVHKRSPRATAEVVGCKVGKIVCVSTGDAAVRDSTVKGAINIVSGGDIELRNLTTNADIEITSREGSATISNVRGGGDVKSISIGNNVPPKVEEAVRKLFE